MKKTLPLLFAVAAMAFSPGRASAQTYSNAITVANPEWNITLTDFGYSDFLLDNTPGFEGREYLSGEWGAAVGYDVGGVTVTPKWLEPNFSYPDWTTNSTFHVVTPIAQQAVLNAYDLPIAQSVISNGHLEITIRNEMLDTVMGTPMGMAAASAGGSGASINSSRYVMQQTLTIKNISGSSISNLQLFQFLHGLQSQRGAYDNRAYTGTMSDFKYDVTQAGVDQWAVSVGSSPAGLEDFIGFHANVAPTGHEIGYYGIEGNGFDNHGLGRPSEGVHLSIADNWQTAPYSTRLGTDYFAPSQRWIGGTQRWNLGGLADNASVAFDMILSLRTGTQVVVGPGSTGGCNGGSGVPGGLDYDFDDATSPGSCFGSYSKASEAELDVRITAGEFGPIDFSRPGGPTQLWNVGFSGTYSGPVRLTFCYDGTMLPAGFAESTLDVFQYDGSNWQVLSGTVNPSTHTIQATTTTLGAFALGVNGGNIYQISAGVEPAGDGVVTGAGAYAEASLVTLTASPANGHVFVSWTEHGGVVSTSPGYTFNAHADRTLVANFAPVVGEAKAISTSSSPPEGGTTSGDGAYANGTRVTVGANVNPGYKFSKWTDNGASVSMSKNYEFTVSGNRALVAVFKPVYLVTVTCDPVNASNGEPFEAEADTPSGYKLGEEATMKITKGWEELGYSFVNWTQNGVVVSTDSSFNFTVTGNRDLVAHFALGHRIDLLATPKTAGTVSGGGVHPDGNTVSLLAEPLPGYLFTSWTEGGIVVNADANYQFSSAANRSLVANFVTIPTPAWEAKPEGLTYKWPANATAWILQESADLASWIDSPRVPLVVGNENQVTTSGYADKTLFFRLTLPTPPVGLLASPAMVPSPQLAAPLNTSTGTGTTGWRKR